MIFDVLAKKDYRTVTIAELRDIHIEDARRVQRLQAETSKRNAHQDVLLPLLMEHQQVISASLLGSQVLDFTRNKDAHEVYVIGDYASAMQNGNEADLLIDTGSDAHCCPKSSCTGSP